MDEENLDKNSLGFVASPSLPQDPQSASAPQLHLTPN